MGRSKHRRAVAAARPAGKLLRPGSNGVPPNKSQPIEALELAKRRALTLEEVADRLALTEEDVQSWLRISRGEVRRYTPVRYRSLLDRIEVLRTLQDREVTSPPSVTINIEKPIAGVSVNISKFKKESAS